MPATTILTQTKPPTDELEIVVYPPQKEERKRTLKKRKYASKTPQELYALRRRYLIKDHTEYAVKSIELLGKYSNITPFIRRRRNGIKLELPPSDAEDNAVIHEDVVHESGEEWIEPEDANLETVQAPLSAPADEFTKSVSRRASHDSNISSMDSEIDVLSVAPQLIGWGNQLGFQVHHPAPLRRDTARGADGIIFKPHEIAGLPPRRAAQYFEEGGEMVGSKKGYFNKCGQLASNSNVYGGSGLGMQSSVNSVTSSITPHQSFTKSSQFISSSQLNSMQRYSLQGSSPQRFPFGQVLTGAMSTTGQHLRKIRTPGNLNSTVTTTLPPHIMQAQLEALYGSPLQKRRPPTAQKSFSKIPSYFL